MIEKNGLPPAKVRQQLGGALDTVALGLDLVVIGSEMLGLSGLAAVARPLAVGLRVVARATSGRK